MASKTIEPKTSDIVTMWDKRIKSAEASFTRWANRFKVEALYQYYEGFQWLYEMDESNRPYVVNLIFANIETKLPNLIFNDPEFTLTPKPAGDDWNLKDEISNTQTRQDALNFICSRNEFGITDKHELAILDAFFAFGALHTGYSDNPAINPNIKRSPAKKDPLDNLFVKHVPFDTVRVSSQANWDLSKGKWIGYFEWVPNHRLRSYETKLNIKDSQYVEGDDLEYMDGQSGKIMVGTDTQTLSMVGPANSTKLWFLWDLETMKFVIFAPDNGHGNNKILENEDFDHLPLDILRFGKRRKGWYPLPPVFNWISPQDEINDVAQTQKVHRKRFTRKYQVLQNSVDQSELDKFLAGADGTAFFIKRPDAITQVQDAPMDPATVQALARSYDDMNRISGSSSERQQVADRTTATQANLMDQAAQIRESKDATRVGNFMEGFGRSTLRALRKVKGNFWIIVKNRSEQMLGQVQQVNKVWKKVPGRIFDGNDFDIQINIASVSPVGQNNEKKAFLEFLGILSQYPLLAFSPALIREAAFKVGYRNMEVIQEFQNFAQLQALGKMVELKQQAGLTPPPNSGPQPPQPGQLPQQQVSQSTPPDANSIMSLLFQKGMPVAQ